MRTELGQLQDLNHIDKNKFTMKGYLKMIRDKTAYYSFYLPIAMALKVCNMEMTKDIRDLSLFLGDFYQIQVSVNVHISTFSINQISFNLFVRMIIWIVLEMSMRLAKLVQTLERGNSVGYL